MPGASGWCGVHGLRARFLLPRMLIVGKHSSNVPTMYVPYCLVTLEIQPNQRLDCKVEPILHGRLGPSVKDVAMLLHAHCYFKACRMGLTWVLSVEAYLATDCSLSNTLSMPDQC